MLSSLVVSLLLLQTQAPAPAAPLPDRGND
jgi:hypothetical protein